MSPNKHNSINQHKPPDAGKPKTLPDKVVTTRSTTAMRNITPNSGKNATEKDNEVITIKDLMDEIKDFRKSMEFMSAKYDELLNKHNLTLEENKHFKTQLQTISDENENLQKNINNINIDINEMKQNKLKRKLVITGAPIVENTEALNSLYENIITKLDIPKEDTKIIDIFQGNRVNSVTQSAPIYIELQHNNIKDTIIKLARTKKLQGHQIGLDTRNHIKIAERLTPYNKELLNKANQLRINGFKFIWVKNGKIYIRKNTDSQVINIKSVIELEKHKQLIESH